MSCKRSIILIMIIMGQEFARYIFEKQYKIKFDENQSCGSRVVPCGRRDRQTDITNFIFAFSSSANAPKKFFLYNCSVHFDIYKVHSPTNALSLV